MVAVVSQLDSSLGVTAEEVCHCLLVNFEERNLDLTVLGQVRPLCELEKDVVEHSLDDALIFGFSEHIACHSPDEILFCWTVFVFDTADGTSTDVEAVGLLPI